MVTCCYCCCWHHTTTVVLFLWTMISLSLISRSSVAAVAAGGGGGNIKYTKNMIATAAATSATFIAPPPTSRFVGHKTSSSSSSSSSLLKATTREIVMLPSFPLCSYRQQHHHLHQRQRQYLAVNLFNKRCLTSTATALLSTLKNNDQEEDSISKKKRKKKKSIPRHKKLFRADRVLANRGWGSRSECFDILRQRRVFQRLENVDYIEGNDDNSDETTDEDNNDDNEKQQPYIMQRILGPSEKIPMDADLWVDGTKQIENTIPPLLRVYHKPKWVLSVMNDNKGRPNLSDLSTDLTNNVHPVGRLDYDTSGLLLFCSDGKLTQTLLHPNKAIEKEYVAIVVGDAVTGENEYNLQKKLASGVTTSMGDFPAQLVSVRKIPTDEIPEIINNIIQNLPPEYDMEKLEEKGYLFFKDAQVLSEVRIIVTEGKHRMVRRILANSGYPVIALKRERLGTINLDDLQEGSYRDINPKEEQWALSLLTKTKKKKN